MKIGFIGLGTMGKPMARNLLKAGHEVVAYDIQKTNIDSVVADGAVLGRSVEDVARQCSLIITMLPNGPEVKDVVFGKEGNPGIIECAEKDTILVDMSSIAPGAAIEIYWACEDRGIKMLDAPVSGGELRAAEGTLSIMAGGKEEVFNQVYDIFMVLGASAVLCGEIGSGNTTKLANQIIVALNIAAVSEAFTLTTKAGVDPNKVFEAIKGGLAGSAVMETKVPMLIDGNFDAGFKIDLHVKDLANALETGVNANISLPFTSQIMKVMQVLQEDGFGQNDHSAVVKFYEKLTGTKIYQG